MAAIVRKLPITNEPTKLILSGGQAVEAKHDQIVLWLSMTRPGLAELSPATPRFPAVLDTGFNNTFLMNERHLHDWVGMGIDDLNWFDFLMADGQALPLCDVDLWIHPNEPYPREPSVRRFPVRLEQLAGVAIWPTTIPGGRRLPLLGLSTFQRSGLQVHIDGRRGLVTFGRSHWWSSFGLVR